MAARRSRRFLLRQWSYDLDTSLLFRPALHLAALLALGWALPPVEASLAARSPSVAALSAFLAPEPATAQLLMATIAGAVMTVVSVVYSILLVALSLASMQFSTRILAGFMRDRLSRNVLGLFIGTFAYCLAVVRSVHTEPVSVPGVAVALGMLLSVVSLGALVLFIHHMVRSIQANVLVDRIAGETEVVLDTVFPPGRPAPPEVPAGPLPYLTPAPWSGYLQLIDMEGLAGVAGGANLRLLRGNGSFVPAGVPIFASDRPLDAVALAACVDVGPQRTMQDDVEYGFRQMVDIALKALSPAVNDPSTAATCIDQLGRLLVRAAGRRMGTLVVSTGGGALVVPAPTFIDVLDLSVEQIRQYGKADMATALRLLRVLAEVRHSTHDPAIHSRLEFHAERVREAAHASFGQVDCEELDRRYAALRAGDPGCGARVMG